LFICHQDYLEAVTAIIDTEIRLTVVHR